MKRKKHTGLVRVIGVAKLLKAVVLGCAAVGLFVNRDLQSLVWRIFGYWNERALTAAGIMTGVYALLFLVEGGGLVAARRWAEWMTVVITASFIPLEIIKLAKHASAAGIVTLVLNVAVVVYLLVRRVRERSAPADAPADAPLHPAPA